jgi:hypothetical protein
MAILPQSHDEGDDITYADPLSNGTPGPAPSANGHSVTPPRPKLLEPLPENFPQRMRDKRQWICWQPRFRNGRWTKVPISPLTGKQAKANNPSTWGTLTEALGYWKAHPNKVKGVGYCFADDGYEVGIDLDNAIDPAAGVLKPWAKAIVDAFGGYCEVSVSGTGAHILATLADEGFPFPDGAGRRRQWADGAVEVYCRRRYFVTTGHILRGSTTVLRDATAPLASLARQVWPEEFPEPQPATGEEPTEGPSQPAGTAGAMTDEEIVELLRGAKNAAKFLALYAGDITGYKSDSEADLALVCLIVFYSRDPEQVSRIFGGSKLAERSKWSDRPDYRERTVKAALDFVKEQYDPCKVPAGLITNYTRDPETKAKIPLCADYILERLSEQTDDWPRRVGVDKPRLFVPDGDRVQYLDSATEMMAWATGQAGSEIVNPFRWARGEGMLSQEGLFESARQRAIRYQAVETLPHVPHLENIYYRHPELKYGDGTALRRLLRMFKPASPIDFDLTQAAFMTPAWGGPPGKRPAFLIESKEDDREKGRGVGKTTLARAIGHLYEGLVCVRSGEDIEKLYTRLLSRAGLDKRICLIDNIKSLRFSWADLEALITGDVISGRALYIGEGRRPNLLTWILTLNGASMSRDMAQRSIPIRLTRPVHDACWEETVWSFISKNRWAILGDIVKELLREVPTLPHYSRWSEWERDVLAHVAEPRECQRAIEERQSLIDDDKSEADLVREGFVEELRARGHCHLRQSVFIPSKVAVEILNETLAERYTVPRGSVFLGTLSIEELRRGHSHGGRKGWVWTGLQSDLAAPRLEIGEREPIPP